MASQPLLFTPVWDHPQLTESDLENHPTTAFEWWYFDFETTDGTECVVVYGYRNPIFCVGKPSVFLQLKSKDTNVLRVRNFAPTEFRKQIDGKDMRLVFGENQTLSMHSEDNSVVWSLEFDLEGVQAKLEMKPCNRGFLPATDGRYMIDPRDGRRSCVSFSCPAAIVSGTLSIGHHTRKIDAVGYHDHPWGTAQLMMTHRRWQWVRARQQEVAVMFAQVLPQPGFVGGLNFLYRGDGTSFDPTIVDNLNISSTDWRKDHFYGIRFPHELEVNTSAGRWRAAATGSLLDVPIYNRAQISWTSERIEDPRGTGWVEYYHVAPRLRRLVRLAAKIGAFFIRRFPFFGQ